MRKKNIGQMDDVLQFVLNIYGYEEVLAQTAEECEEFGWAALKMRRIRKGTSPADPQEIKKKLTEEAADILLCIRALELAGYLNPDEIGRIQEDKLDRWEERAKEYARRLHGFLEGGWSRRNDDLLGDTKIFDSTGQLCHHSGLSVWWRNVGTIVEHDKGTEGEKHGKSDV